MNDVKKIQKNSKQNSIGLATIFLAGILLFGTVSPSMVYGQAVNPNGQGPTSTIPEDAKVGDPIPGAFIIVLKEGFSPRDVAFSNGVSPDNVYSHALNGFSVSGVSKQNAQELQKDPRVKYVEQDIVVKVFGQNLPTGIDRVQADKNTVANIDGSDDRVSVDIAIIDTGVDLDHPDLNVVKSTNCASGGPFDTTCDDGDGDDGNGHGTHVAGTAAALDNGEGVVGMAPGAGIWAVKVLKDNGSGRLSDVIQGVDWVTSNADQIEVANMSLGASDTWSESFRDAVKNSVAAGVVYVVAAGNDSEDIYGGDGTIADGNEVIPAAFPEVAAVTAMADSDGEPGGNGASTSYGEDDSFASFSNYGENVVSGNPVTSPGASIDLLMPGVEILSTWKDGEYNTISGTSMSSPHGAGLAGLYIAKNGADTDGDGDTDSDDVYNIRQALIDDGVKQNSDNGLAKLNDPDGNEERIGWAQDTVGEPPTTSWINPTDGDTVSGTSVNIEIDASDKEDADDSLTVEWEVDDSGNWNNATWSDTCGCYTDSWDSTTVSDGNHNLDARATDSDGNTSSESRITVTVDNNDNAPTTSWINPTDGDTVSGTVAIEIDASDDRDSGSDLTVEWEVDDSGNWNNATWSDTCGCYTDSWDSTTVSDGDHNLDARATDTSGNTGPESRITVTVDNSEGSSTEMYVWEMSWSEKHRGPGGSFTDLSTTVDINQDSDADGTAESGDDPAKNAAVTFVLTHDTDGDGVFEPGGDDDSWTFSDETSGEGQVTFTLKFAPDGDYQGEVTDLTHDSLSWNSNLDADNPDSYFGVPNGSE